MNIHSYEIYKRYGVMMKTQQNCLQKIYNTVITSMFCTKVEFYARKKETRTNRPQRHYRQTLLCLHPRFHFSSYGYGSTSLFHFLGTYHAQEGRPRTSRTTSHVQAIRRNAENETEGNEVSHAL